MAGEYDVRVSAKAFSAMQSLNIVNLLTCTQEEVRPILPSLVRMSLLSPIEYTKNSVERRKQILSILVENEVVNNIVSLLQIDYQELEVDVKKEQLMRQKVGTNQQDSAQFHGLENGSALGFERADVTRKVRVVLSELFYIQSQIIEQNQLGTNRNQNDNILKLSELFDNEIYLEEIADIICIALAELPSLFNVQEVIETLLYVNNGTTIICWIVANMPDCFREVVTSLITNGDEDSPEGRLRLQALFALCDMNPGQALSIRTLCVEIQEMPSLMLRLSLKLPEDLIAFISGLLLGNDQNSRTWFASYIRNSQKRKGDALHLVRDELQKQLEILELAFNSDEMTDELIVQASALIRLFCALRGIAGIKFSNEEINSLMQLILSKPKPTPAGIRFVSLGLCILIACPSLIANEKEAKAIAWIQWLIKEETYFVSNSGTDGSFGEMLLLMAIHFHGNQVAAICELVCGTLGMKIPIRANTTTRMKHIFTQEIFTEQVVAAHAVKVPVTPNLHANIPGHLPVHCIHQLLKSRAFSKHKVPIKSWIYKQICTSTSPLHPVLPSLIEVYVNSMILPHTKGPNEHTHRPLSEREIIKVFRHSVVGNMMNIKKRNFSIEFEMDSNEGDDEIEGVPTITSQLLVLYYLLLYEDVRLSNMVFILSNGRKLKSYSTEFLSELPIRHLLQQAQRNQHEYCGLFSPLLRLLITHFPHLSLVDDWIDEDTILWNLPSGLQIQEIHLVEAFEELDISPSSIIKLLRSMLKKSPMDIWHLAERFIHYFKKIIDLKVSRLVQELYKKVWLRLNSVLPRRLWTMSITALLPEDNLYKILKGTQDGHILDPLQVLRCDKRIYRCPDGLSIVLRILQAMLAASKSQLTRHIADKPFVEKLIQPQAENEREELKATLIASQESAAVQILLEACLETEEDRQNEGQLWALREVRGIICSFIHQMFITEPTLAKLVHFQGYPRELLSMTVRGIPSMHICLDFLPELLAMPEIERQIFAIDLTSHLSLQYAMPKSLSVSKLCLNTLSTLLTLLSSDARVSMFRAVLPCIVRIAEAFPLFIDDCLLLLMQLGRVIEAQSALSRSISLPTLTQIPSSRVRAETKKSLQATLLVDEIKEAFSKLLDEAVLNPKIY